MSPENDHKYTLPSSNFSAIDSTIGKSMCISEVHGGAGLGCGPASAHYIAEQA